VLLLEMGPQLRLALPLLMALVEMRCCCCCCLVHVWKSQAARVEEEPELQPLEL
jgi:hypothetical protein